MNFQPLFVGNGPDLDIRGMDANQRMDAYFTLPQHTKIITFEPHMHAPGVRMCLEAIWGITVQTLSCAGYNHSWVRVYNYADDAAPLLPKGTILHVVGYFDNSPANKNVADPRNWSGSGHRSVDNMVINLMQAIYLNDEQFQAELATRREKLNLKEGQTVIGCPLCGAPAPPVSGGRPELTRALRASSVRRRGRDRVWRFRGIGAQESFSSGQNIAPVYEGWEQNPDGSFNLVFGYFNRNWEEEIDVPIGADNTIEPGGPDQGQPTHFLPRRNRFLFRIRVAKDFGKREIVWTLTSHGKTERAYATLKARLLHRRHA